MKRFIVIVLMSFFLVSGCARVPRPKTSEHVLNGYFHKYGRKFKESDFGKYKVDHVNIFYTEEIHKNMVAVTAEILFKEGPSQNVRAILQRKTLGWRIISWERL